MSIYFREIVGNDWVPAEDRLFLQCICSRGHSPLYAQVLGEWWLYTGYFRTERDLSDSTWETRVLRPRAYDISLIPCSLRTRMEQLGVFDRWVEDLDMLRDKFDSGVLPAEY